MSESNFPIPELWFDNEKNEVFKDFQVVDSNGEQSNHLTNLSQINIFIGPNNSGKSRFMREVSLQLLKFSQEGRKTQTGPARAVELPSPPNSDVDIPIYSIETFKKIHSLMETANTTEEMAFSAYEKIKSGFHSYNKIVEFYNPLQNRDSKEFGDLGLLDFHGLVKSIEDATIDNINSFQPKITFIPITRSTQKIHETDHEILKKAYYGAYFVNNYQFVDTIFTGESIFKDISQKLRESNRSKRKMRTFEQFLSLNFFDGQEISISTPEYKGSGPKNTAETTELNHEILFAINDIEYPIKELGDGLAAVPILTYPLFIEMDQPHILFIDEPELNLHPGFQRIFLETLASDKFKNTQIFLNTHSNHFLDMSLDMTDKISVYSFQKKERTADGKSQPSFEIKQVAGPEKKVLQLLGVRNSSVFLSNCTIWVEGITDRLYIRKWLDVYQRESKKTRIFKEDLHYSFVEFGGANINHWSFLDDGFQKDAEEKINVVQLCGNPLIIADKDGHEKSEMHKKMKTLLGHDRYKQLERREIENLLSAVVLKKTLTIYERNAHKDTEHNPEFGEFAYEDYKDIYLGGFIDSIVLPKDKRKINRYGKDAKASTIQDKTTFCKRAISVTETIDDLSPDAKQLVEKIYQFIQSNN